MVEIQSNLSTPTDEPWQISTKIGRKFLAWHDGVLSRDPVCTFQRMHGQRLRSLKINQQIQQNKDLEWLKSVEHAEIETRTELFGHIWHIWNSDKFRSRGTTQGRIFFLNVVWECLRYSSWSFLDCIDVLFAGGWEITINQGWKDGRAYF